MGSVREGGGDRQEGGIKMDGRDGQRERGWKGALKKMDM